MFNVDLILCPYFNAFPPNYMAFWAFISSYVWLIVWNERTVAISTASGQTARPATSTLDCRSDMLVVMEPPRTGLNELEEWNGEVRLQGASILIILLLLLFLFLVFFFFLVSLLIVYLFFFFNILITVLLMIPSTIFVHVKHRLPIFISRAFCSISSPSLLCVCLRLFHWLRFCSFLDGFSLTKFCCRSCFGFSNRFD